MVKMKHSQLHDQIVMGPTLVELLHPHNVLVLDSGTKRVIWVPNRQKRVGETRRKSHLLSTVISFSRLRSLFCFFFTHFMANIFPVFFSFTMYTSEKAPLLNHADATLVRGRNGLLSNHKDFRGC